MFPEENVEIIEGQDRSHFNYGTISGRSIAYIFDFLRYNSAFLARTQDVETLREAAQNYGDWITRPFHMVVCRYSFAGVTKPGWETGPLPSDCDFETHRDAMHLIQLGVDEPRFKPSNKLKFKHVCNSEGTIRWQLQNMFDNQAFPHRETDARVLEREMQWHFIHGEMKPFTIELANYRQSRTSWIWPPRPATTTT